MNIEINIFYHSGRSVTICLEDDKLKSELKIKMFLMLVFKNRKEKSDEILYFVFYV